MSMKLEEFARESRATHKGDKSGVPIVGLEHLIPQEIKFSGYDVDTENTFTKTFKKGQILFGRRRAYLKKAAIADFDGICSGDITVIEAIPAKVDPLLLPFIIQNDKFFDYAVSRSAGGLSPRVKWEHLKDYEFDLPPIEEQRILADKLWAAYRLKESYKKLLSATQEMVKSQFIEMFGNPLSSIQKNELKRLGDCCQINPRRPSVSISDSDLVSFVPMPAVNEDGYIDGATNEEYGKVKKGFTYFENNDVLFAKITPCMENGKGAIAEALTNGIGMGSTEFHVLRPIEGMSNPYWLLTLTRMPIFRECAAKNMSGTGGQRRVGAAFLENFMIGLPSISEQETFETIYRQADKSEFVGCKSQFIEMFGNQNTNDKGWTESLVKDEFKLSMGKTPARNNPECWDNGTHKWVSISDMSSYTRYTGDTSEYITDYAIADSGIKAVPKGTIIMSFKLSIGRTAITSEDLYTNEAIMAFAGFDEKKFNIDFLHFLIANKNWLLGAKQAVKGQTLNKESIGNAKIIIPPIEAQEEFASIYNQADKSEFELRKSIEAIDQVIKSLIN